MGILDNKTIKIPTTITIQPIKNKGASIFILKYIIQDEVVNGNVLNLPTHKKYSHTEHTENTEKEKRYLRFF